jgi:hypothetical protein
LRFEATVFGGGFEVLQSVERGLVAGFGVFAHDIQ